MNKVEFKPSLFSFGRLLLVSSLIIITILFGFWLLPKAINLYKEYPSQETLQVLIFIIGGLAIYWIVAGLIILIQLQKNKILIDDQFLYYYYKPVLGSSQDKIINLKDINLVGYRQQVVPMFTGKTFIPIVRIWLIFNHNDGHKEEIYISDWDKGSLKNIIFYLKGKFSNIKFDTQIYRDSSEKLSGLDELKR
ncbi:MAG: hypothetical protein V1858_04850 [Candidatus Gottesmanbacteria bacterium]